MNMTNNYISFTYRNCALSYIYFRRDELKIRFGKEEYKLNIPSNLEIKNVRIGNEPPKWSAHYEATIKDSNNWYGIVIIAKQIYDKIDEEYQK